MPIDDTLVKAMLKHPEPSDRFNIACRSPRGEISTTIAPLIKSNVLEDWFLNANSSTRE